MSHFARYERVPWLIMADLTQFDTAASSFDFHSFVFRFSFAVMLYFHFMSSSLSWEFIKTTKLLKSYHHSTQDESTSVPIYQTERRSQLGARTP